MYVTKFDVFDSLGLNGDENYQGRIHYSGTGQIM